MNRTKLELRVALRVVCRTPVLVGAVGGGSASARSRGVGRCREARGDAEARRRAGGMLRARTHLAWWPWRDEMRAGSVGARVGGREGSVGRVARVFARVSGVVAEKEVGEKHRPAAEPLRRGRRVELDGMSHDPWRLVPIDAFSDQEKCGGLPVSIARLPSLAREGDDRHRRRHRRSCRRHAHGARRRRCRPQLLGGRPHGAQGTRRSIVGSVFVGGHRRSVLLSRGLSPLLLDTSLTSRCPVNVHLHRIQSLVSPRCSSRTRTPIR